MHPLKNQNQIINAGMIGHVSAEHTELLEGSGACSPGKNILIPQTAANALKLLFLPITTLFCITLKQADL